MEMKKRKLTKTGKVVFTSTTIILSVIIYHLMGILGAFASESIIYLLAVILGWSWLIIGQVVVIDLIWE